MKTSNENTNLSTKKEKTFAKFALYQIKEALDSIKNGVFLF